MKNWFIDIFQLIGKRSRNYLILSTILGVVWFGIELSFVFILQGFLFSLKLLTPDKLQIPSWYPTGIAYSVSFLIIFGILRAFVNYSKSFFSTVAQHSFIRVAREELIDNGLDSKKFSSSSEFVTLFSERINQAGIFIQYLSLGVVSLLAVILFLIFGLYYAPREMFFCLIALSCLMIPIKKSTLKIQKIAESLLCQWSQINEDVLLVKRNMFFLTVYDLVKNKKSDLNKQLHSYEANYVSYASASSFLTSLPLFVGIVVLSLCSYLSIEYFKTEGIRVLGFFYMFLRFSQGLSELNSIYAVLKLTHPSFLDVKKNILELRLLNSKSSQLALGHKLFHDESGHQVNVQLNKMTFAYANGREIYSNMDLELSSKDVLVIKGPSGAGKSTLLKILLGIEKPTSGSVMINGHAVSALDSSWRTRLGYVGPDPYLVKGTIKDNLDFGNTKNLSLVDSDYFKALELAGLSDEFQNSGITLSTFISEASFLSTGQMQRLAIARAYLRNPLIVILDEATANLDPEIEKQIISSISSFSDQVLTIIVTHKSSFDKIGTKFINVGM